MFNTEIKQIDKKSLQWAKKLLEEDELVVFPTETVYGLGANAFSDKAIQKIYEVKGRPSNNPLIVHVHENYDIDKLVYRDYDYVYKLAERFLPGPLTMVYRSKGVVSPLVCGLGTLAIRIPEHKGCQEFLKFVDMPIPAPSANISKHVSPVTAEHVFKDFNKKIPLILQGGRCEGGIESTVLDVTGEVPVILRKGLVTAEMIKQVVGECLYADERVVGQTRSPGMKYSHYCPTCETALFERSKVQDALNLYESAVKSGKRVAILADGEMAKKLSDKNLLLLGDTGEQMARNLYQLLREAERDYDILISFELDIKDEITLSVNNRFLKAFGKGSK